MYNKEQAKIARGLFMSDILKTSFSLETASPEHARDYRIEQAKCEQARETRQKTALKIMAEDKILPSERIVLEILATEPDHLTPALQKQIHAFRSPTAITLALELVEANLIEAPARRTMLQIERNEHHDTTIARAETRQAELKKQEDWHRVFAQNDAREQKRFENIQPYYKSDLVQPQREKLAEFDRIQFIPLFEGPLLNLFHDLTEIKKTLVGLEMTLPKNPKPEAPALTATAAFQKPALRIVQNSP